MHRPINLLFIEDDANDRALILRSVRNQFSNLTITEIATREQYLAILNSDKQFNVLITDYYLGWENGLDIITEFRRRYPDLVILMVTITGREEIAVEALKRGADDYILKRTDELTRLPAAIRNCLDTVENRIALRDAEKKKNQLLDNLRSANEALAAANKRLQAALSESQVLSEKAEEANRAKSDFLAVMSHELRTPLNPILGFSELLAQTVTSDEQKSWVLMIRQSGEQLLELIEDVLDYIKLEARKRTANNESVEIGQLLESIINPFVGLAKQRGLDFRKPNLENIALVSGVTDPQFIRQILGNLLGNALKFTPSGWISVDCVLTPPDANGKPHILKIVVADSGIGIPADRIDRIFEPFFQAETGSTRRYGGIGLGLAISRNLVNEIGGSISVHSKQGEGSSFTVFLPLKEVKNLTQTEESVSQAETHFEPVDVVVVEDDAINQNVLANFVNRLTQSMPRLANSGADAIRLIDSRKPDVIFLDLHMPEMDGYACTRLIREKFAHGPQPYIIAVTADARPQTRHRCLLAGMNDYLPKPVSLGQVRQALSKALSKV